MARYGPVHIHASPGTLGRKIHTFLLHYLPHQHLQLHKVSDADSLPKSSYFPESLPALACCPNDKLQIPDTPAHDSFTVEPQGVHCQPACAYNTHMPISCSPSLSCLLPGGPGASGICSYTKSRGFVTVKHMTTSNQKLTNEPAITPGHLYTGWCLNWRNLMVVPNCVLHQSKLAQQQ